MHLVGEWVRSAAKQTFCSLFVISRVTSVFWNHFPTGFCLFFTFLFFWFFCAEVDLLLSSESCGNPRDKVAGCPQLGFATWEIMMISLEICSQLCESFHALRKIQMASFQITTKWHIELVFKITSFQVAHFTATGRFQSYFTPADIFRACTKHSQNSSTITDLLGLKNSHWNHNLLFLIPVSCSPNCVHHFFSKDGTKGPFSSPNYPDPYPTETRCIYNFLGAPDERVRISFEVFDLQEGTKAG